MSFDTMKYTKYAMYYVMHLMNGYIKRRFLLFIIFNYKELQTIARELKEELDYK